MELVDRALESRTEVFVLASEACLTRESHVRFAVLGMEPGCVWFVGRNFKDDQQIY